MEVEYKLDKNSSRRLQFKVHSLILTHFLMDECLCASHSIFHVLRIFYNSVFVLRAVGLFEDFINT